MEEEKEKPVEELPAGQGWFDKIFLWFIISLLLSVLLYNVWGLIELYSLSPAP